MGFLADYCLSDKSNRAVWDRAFGVNKESGSRVPDPQRNANDRGRSLALDAATRRLLQALRSDAPGTWTDDRSTSCKEAR